ncbi:hypothetical protein ACIA8K_30725 [Catenuloplanes sp. NPDC051500]|uniref:hypothetical protein n=1 Tax=Catenuloplanes sp. NPDC051500 TaxID=3363959 RepID=UPI0037B3CDB0
MTDIYASPTASESDSYTSTTEKAKEQARELGHTAAQAGGGVAETAKEEGRRVAGETTRQARTLYHATREELRSQAGDQQKRAVGGIRSVGSELRSMADQGGQEGPASGYARQAASKIDQVADWLESREPGALVTEVKEYARRNPGTFLAGAAILGVIAGRVTRSVAAEVSDARHDDTPSSATPSSATSSAAGYAPAYTAPAVTPVAVVPVEPLAATPATTAPLPVADPGPGVAVGTAPVTDPFYDREVRP